MTTIENPPPSNTCSTDTSTSFSSSFVSEPTIVDQYPFDSHRLAIKTKGLLTQEDQLFLEDLNNADWSQVSLELNNEEHRSLGARALALGVPVFHGFGNFYALTFHPHIDVMRSVNASKGRPLDQVASITTTRDHIDNLFAWDQLPEGLNRDSIKHMIDKFFEMGPFGFRGPATEAISQKHLHLTSMSGDLRTVQLIAPGYNCKSNDLYEKALFESGENYLAITSANLSKTRKGGVVQAAHNRMEGIQRDFGKAAPQALMLAHKNERLTRMRYGLRHGYQPTSTSIIGFHQSFEGEPVVTIDRHGSLPVDKIVHVVESFGMRAEMTEGAKERQPLARY